MNHTHCSLDAILQFTPKLDATFILSIPIGSLKLSTVCSTSSSVLHSIQMHPMEAFELPNMVVLSRYRRNANSSASCHVLSSSVATELWQPRAAMFSSPSTRTKMFLKHLFEPSSPVPNVDCTSFWYLLPFLMNLSFFMIL